MEQNTFFAGISGAVLDEDSGDDLDGSLSLGFGLGNSAEKTGFEITGNIISLTDGFGEDGSIGLKWHASVFDTETRVAIGSTNLVRFGAADLVDTTVYGVVSRRVEFKNRAAAISVGLGSGALNGTGDDSGISPFLSGVVQLNRNVSLIAGAARDTIGAGFTIAFSGSPLVFTGGFTNIDVGGTSRTSAISTIGFSRRFN